MIQNLPTVLRPVGHLGFWIDPATGEPFLDDGYGNLIQVPDDFEGAAIFHPAPDPTI